MQTDKRVGEHDLAEPIRLLLVEDDVDTANAMKDLMQKHDIVVEIALSAEEAVTKIKPNAFDAVVTDIKLKEMSGVDLLRHIRTEMQDLPVILVTGYDSLGTAIESLQLGAQDYILKPLDSIDDVLLPVTKAVRKYRFLMRNRKLERQLAESEARLRCVLENSADILYSLDLARNSIDYVNPTVETVLGYSRRDFESTSISSFFEMIHPDDREKTRTAFTEIATRGLDDPVLPRMECRFRRKNGEYIWMSIVHSAVFGSDGELLSLVGNARDITESRNAEQRAREIHDKLRRAERLESLAVIAAGVAHDVNNAIMPIVAMKDLLELDLKDLSKPDSIKSIRKYAHDASETSRRVADIVSDLLCLGQEGKYELTELSLNSIIEEYFGTMAFHALTAKRTNVMFTRTLCQDALLIMGSQSHLHRVIMNLCSNACEAMPDGGCFAIHSSIERVENDLIGYELIKPGEYAVVKFRDSGVGISKEHLDKIFEPFFSTKPMEHNKGLGTTIVRRIVKDHNGYIDVRSELGKGTEFILYFPLLRETCPEQQGGEAISDNADAVELVEMAESPLRTAGTR